ncbi:methyltransferase type 11 [Streptacidiphilus sp. PB12-B1b]|uniref:methyltransferase type 11 n=1 Tax=Streptacidiphilus sp. PB12-B1b TaxID=2705012 RepID=UPI001CDBB1BE|nr:methyltransferase type 11 [Streptacidiphilus sp. PB12-B1b]
MGAPHDDVAPPPWLAVVADVRERYLGPVRRAGSGTYTEPAERHEPVLARSAFCRMEAVQWDRVLERDLDQVVGLQFSYSFSSPLQLGSAKDAFEAELRAALTAAVPDGRYRELVRTEAVIATRGGAVR